MRISGKHPISNKHKVYEQIWIDRGRPQGNAEYGRHTFHDTNGLLSTMQEKAVAIDRYLMSIGGTACNAPEQAQVSYAQYVCSIQQPRLENGRIKYRYPYELVKVDKDWCPTTKEECLQLGVALAALGTMTAGAYGIFQAIRSIRGIIG